MILTGVTKSMLDKAIREEPLLQGGIKCHPPTGAIEEVAKAMHEHSCAEWDHTLDEQEAWDRLPPGAKQLALRHAAWLIGRLALQGYGIIKVQRNTR